MLIGIDGNEANVLQKVGSNVYAFEILQQLKKQISSLKNQKTNLNFKIFLKNKPLNDLPKESQKWHYQVLKPGFWWTQWRLPLALYFSSGKLSLFFTLGHYAPRFCPSPIVIIIMDLAFLRFPEQFKKKDLFQLTNWTSYSVAKAAHIFTISEFTKKEINYFYNYPEEKITVTYPGVNHLKFQNPKLKYNLKYNFKDYFLYLGTLQPRKNLIRLIEAFAKVLKWCQKEKKEKEIKLVLAGKKGWLYEEIFKKVKELSLADKVIFLDYVTEETKIALLKNALVFVYPSLYEGFGLPVLEAMAAGCPVITSNVSSLPEVAGKAAIYIDNPYEVSSIQKSLVKMLKLNQSQREVLIKEGFKQAKKMSWERCGQKMWEVLCSLLKINLAGN